MGFTEIANATRIAAAVVVGMFAMASGCAEKDVDVWTPKPQVQWEDITIGPVAPVSNGYRILTGGPTQGLFPASIAVTRVTIEEGDGVGTSSAKRLSCDPRNEFLQWNSAFDDQMAISEVFPIAERDLGGGEVEPERITDAIHALHARMGLVYAVNELSESESEMLGVLSDAASAQPLATFHARAASILPKEEESDRESTDLWRTDSRALVRQEFQRHVHACVRELILRDQSGEVESREGWTPVGPIRPVEWPPKRLRTGR